MPCICKNPLPRLKPDGKSFACGNATCGSDCDPPPYAFGETKSAPMPVETTATGSATASGGDSVSTFEVVRYRDDSGRTFWELLKTEMAQDLIGTMSLGPSLLGDLKDPGQNNGGLLWVRAVRNETGWRLDGTFDRTDGSVAMYFLPWKEGTVTYAQRSWYEDSVCDYFFTTRLTGCRFVLTPTQVLHVASDAGGNRLSKGPEGSKYRTRAEGAVTNWYNKARRHSASGISHEQGETEGGYGGQGYAFGYKTSTGWVYKVYATKTKGWETWGPDTFE